MKVGSGMISTFGPTTFCSSAWTVVGSTPGHDAAVDRRLGGLGKRIVGMARRSASSRRSGSGSGRLRARSPRSRPLPRRRSDSQASAAWHRPARPVFRLRTRREIGAGDVVEHRLEPVRLQLLQRVGQIVDRIVRPRAGAVAARIAGREEIGLVGLLGGIEPEAERPAVRGRRSRRRRPRSGRTPRPSGCAIRSSP